MGMTWSPLTTAASAALSFGTSNPILSSALARSAIGRTPLTVRTPPVGKLPPPDQRTETRQFLTFSAITSLPGHSDNLWRTPPQEANRPLAVHDATCETAGTWNYGYGNRENGRRTRTARLNPIDCESSSS